MKKMLKIFNLKNSLIITGVALFLLVIANFYGPYSGKFYFFKPGNYILPVLSIGHFIYLYVLWFKVKEEELTDPPMRNLEYALYAIGMVYVFKAIESVKVLVTYQDYEFHILPQLFLPICIGVTVLYIILIAFSVLLFKHRKDRIGAYRFDQMNHIDSWE